MVSIGSLWLPILVSAILVFLLSWIIHMFLGYHRNDFKKPANEDAVQDAIRKLDLPPGEYMVPCAGSPEAMRQPEFMAKLEKGPIVIMALKPGGKPNMGKSLGQWFLYCLLVGFITAYLASHSLPMGATYRQVMRIVGCTAFMGYSLALLQSSIWYWRSWGATLRNVFDGLLYGLVTGGAFGWLWPR